MRRLFVAVVLLCLVPVTGVYAQTGVSDARFARLAKGVNLSNWFWYRPTGEMGIRAQFADSEFVALHRMGITSCGSRSICHFCWTKARLIY